MNVRTSVADTPEAMTCSTADATLAVVWASKRRAFQGKDKGDGFLSMATSFLTSDNNDTRPVLEMGSQVADVLVSTNCFV